MNAKRLLEGNRAWVRNKLQHDPEYFSRRGAAHEPGCLFIGCSDARVPADLITQVEVGEVFVHRNIANQVIATDNNLQAVVQYAVDVLKVSSIIVCGHEDCGGVKASLGPAAPPHVEHWIAHVRNVARLHASELDTLEDHDARCRRLVELNVVEQVFNLSRLPAVQQARASGRSLELHGWVYGVRDGLLRDLEVTRKYQGPSHNTRREYIPRAVRREDVVTL